MSKPNELEAKYMAYREAQSALQDLPKDASPDERRTAQRKLETAHNAYTKVSGAVVKRAARDETFMEGFNTFLKGKPSEAFNKGISEAVDMIVEYHKSELPPDARFFDVVEDVGRTGLSVASQIPEGMMFIAEQPVHLAGAMYDHYMGNPAEYYNEETGEYEPYETIETDEGMVEPGIFDRYLDRLDNPDLPSGYIEERREDIYPTYEPKSAVGKIADTGLTIAGVGSGLYGLGRGAKRLVKTGAGAVNRRLRGQPADIGRGWKENAPPPTVGDRGLGYLRRELQKLADTPVRQGWKK